MKTIITILSTIVLMFAGATLSNAQELAPCQHEDSINCYWDAETMGNGQGQSFMSDTQGNVTYTLESQAWELWDAVGASSLLTDTETRVEFAGYNTTGFPYLTDNMITVWDTQGNHYLFIVS